MTLGLSSSLSFAFAFVSHQARSWGEVVLAWPFDALYLPPLIRYLWLSFFFILGSHYYHIVNK